MKKRLLALLCAALFVCPASAESGYFYFAPSHQIEAREYPVYFDSMDLYLTDPFPLYFVDGADDLPYVELADWRNFMTTYYNEVLGDTGYAIEMTEDEAKVIYSRENAWSMTFDTDDDTIVFNDYNGFVHDSSDSSLLDMLSMTGFNAAGLPELFQRDTNASYDRNGRIVTLSLADYRIDMLFQQGRHYVPLQTVSDLLLAPRLSNAFFNGKALFITDGSAFGSISGGYTDIGDYYYSAPTGERSQALAEFSYNELCFVLDNFYGLKESHSIESFDRLFLETDFKTDLLGTDPVKADLALDRFIDYILDDQHSLFKGFSYLSGKSAANGSFGLASRKYDALAQRYAAARSAAYPGGIPAYEEIGNTAYITLDAFSCDSETSYYDGARGDRTEDTISLILYAHSQITRPGSPIENVVLDLSCNGGGMVDAALYTIAWYLGDAPFSVQDTFSGAQSTALYRADVNLDRAFDSRDTVADKNLYCLISPVSFSCGNLVPAVFKSSQRVTLLGRTSGGGSCTVLPLSTAYGSVFQISSSQRMSFIKNGSFYDIDQGVAPDYPIDKTTSFYDRVKLTEYINGLL